MHKATNNPHTLDVIISFSVLVGMIFAYTWRVQRTTSSLAITITVYPDLHVYPHKCTTHIPHHNAITPRHARDRMLRSLREIHLIDSSVHMNGNHIAASTGSSANLIHFMVVSEGVHHLPFLGSKDATHAPHNFSQHSIQRLAPCVLFNQLRCSMLQPSNRNSIPNLQNYHQQKISSCWLSSGSIVSQQARSYSETKSKPAVIWGF